MKKLDELSETRRRALQRLTDASSIADVARKSNRDPAQLWGMVKGTRPFGERVARSLELSLGLPSGFFDQSEATPQDNITPKGWSKVPLIDWHDAPSFSTAPHKDFVFTMQNRSPLSFGVTLIDDAMSPTMKMNDIALIDPELVPKPGNIVLAIVNGQPMIGRYKQRSLNVFEITADNQNYPSVSSEEAEIKIIGTAYQILVNTI